jgi:PAS domain S-box-containing protein
MNQVGEYHSFAPPKYGLQWKSAFVAFGSTHSREAYRSMILIIFLLFVAELFEMFILSLMPPMRGWVVAFLDATILVLIFFPLYYFFVFRKFVQYVTELKQTDNELKLRTFELGERVKELDCLYNVSKHIEETEKPLDETLQAVVDLIPPGWQYPEITCARIVLDDQTVETANYQETIWKQTADFFVHGHRVGSLEVFYLDERPELDEGVFLKEERNLINAIVGRLGKYIQRLRAEEALQRAHDELEKRVEERTFDLTAANKKLMAEIEARQMVQTELKESKILLQEVFDGILDPLVMVDNEMSVKMLNRSALEYYGIDPHEIVGKPCHDAFRGQAISCKGCRLPTALRDGKPVVFERRGYMNSDRTEQMSVYPLRENGSATDGAIIRVSDITQKKEVEKQLMRADRLSSLGQLSGGIAHEIRNPLSGINLFVDILGDEEKFNRSNQELEILQEIKQNIHKINGIIKRILDMAKPTLMEPKEIDINGFIEETVKFWHAKTNDAEIKLKLSLQKGLQVVCGDSIGIQQVLNNLIQNAIEAMTDGGTLSITTQNGVSSFDPDRPMVLIKVGDTGPGIEPEQREKIFDPFFTTKTTGTGLGLSLSYQIIDHHGGIIALENDPDQATSFVIELPSAPRSG